MYSKTMSQSIRKLPIQISNIQSVIIVIIVLLLAEMTFNWRLEDNTKLDIGVDQVNVRYMNWAPDHPVVTGHYHRDLCVAANYRSVSLIVQ